MKTSPEEDGLLFFKDQKYGLVIGGLLGLVIGIIIGIAIMLSVG